MEKLTQRFKFSPAIIILIVVCIFIQCSLTDSQTKLEKIKKQLIKKDNIFAGRFPEYTEDGKWIFSERPNWFAGFTGGELWYMYEMTGDEALKTRAIKHADQLIPYSTLDNTHDMGFIFLPTCVKTYQITKDEKYRQAAIQAAEMLAKRYNKKCKFIRAWGKLGTPQKAGWMIIDTLMNLELLFWAAEETGNQKFYDIAYSHAVTCAKQHVRSNSSSYHVVEFDTLTGAVVDRRTRQGYSNESTWARGQAWGIYGFANIYQRTGDENFLNTSIAMADYFISFLPEDYVPYWDLDLSGKDVFRDASAGAIAASGLFLLADQMREKELKRKYIDYAQKITYSLIENYLFTKSKRNIEEGILIRTVYHNLKKFGINESYPAGDYYFIEAVKKLWERNKLLVEKL